MTVQGKTSMNASRFGMERDFACKIAVLLLTILFSASVFAAGERETTSAIEPLYRAYRFSTQPDLNPEVTFRVKELRVPGLWAALAIQLFVADDLIDGQVLPRDPFLYFKGAIHPFVNSIGGHGVMSGVVSGDAFYYSYSWGSGIHRSLVGRLTIKEGRPIREESRALWNTDMFVEKSADGRVRIVEARWREFNRWEKGVPLGWIDGAEGSRLKMVDDYGREVQLPVRR
jgi:hypothetical protein